MPAVADPEVRPIAPPSRTAAVALPAGVIFLSAFLLFQIQPLIAKMILPWFGGSAAVWTTCVLFFQAALFLGYVYAHWLVERVAPKRQGWLHTALLAASLAVLPVIPQETWKPVGAAEPLTRILGLLCATVGLPYLLLSSTSPLAQAWMARRGITALPYRFYALSNLASLLALLAYPVLLEPLVPARAQALGWSAAFALYAALMAALALTGRAGRAAVPVLPRAGGELPRGRPVLWLLLAAVPSALSLAVTNHLCQNVAPIPFLWVLPLGVYLLSLILCFDSDGWSRRPLLVPLHAAALAGAAWLLVRQTPETPVRLVVPAFTAALFVFCMYLHGELARRKPPERYLTHFYLALALGGMIGGVLVSLGAPLLLPGYWEFPLALAGCALLTLMLEYRKHWASDIIWTAVAVASVVAAMALVASLRQGATVMVRNFYGGLRILDSPADRELPPRRTMVHGAISHGFQFLHPVRRRDATTYYAPGSGVQLALEYFRRPAMQVGVVGLGAGTLAAYGRPGELYRFYEINPEVAALARGRFTFLTDSKAAAEIVLGDGRLCLEREPPRRFDVLVIDAFSGDSIPVHLLTRQAVALYLSRLRDDGVVALHVSNTALRLAPVVASVAAALDREALLLAAAEDRRLGRSESEWVLVAARDAFDRRPALRRLALPAPLDPSVRAWTDDYSNLFRILK